MDYLHRTINGLSIEARSTLLLFNCFFFTYNSVGLNYFYQGNILFHKTIINTGPALHYYFIVLFIFIIALDRTTFIKETF